MMSEEKTSTLQFRLQEALKIRKIKPCELSKKLKISKGAISYYLSGKTTPKADRLRIICKELNVSEAWMLGYCVPMEMNSIDTETKKTPNNNHECTNASLLDLSISKCVDVLLELQIPEEIIKQMILKHFDIRYSEITMILKTKNEKTT